MRNTVDCYEEFLKLLLKCKAEKKNQQKQELERLDKERLSLESELVQMSESDTGYQTKREKQDRRLMRMIELEAEMGIYLEDY